MKNRMCNGKLSERVINKNKDDRFYPLVNIQKNMKNQSFLMGKPTISMAMFNSYVKLPDSTVSWKIGGVSLKIEWKGHQQKTGWQFCGFGKKLSCGKWKFGGFHMTVQGANWWWKLVWVWGLVVMMLWSFEIMLTRAGRSKEPTQTHGQGSFWKVKDWKGSFCSRPSLDEIPMINHWIWVHPWTNMAVCQNRVPLVNIKIAGKWMFIPLKMVCIGIDP